MADIGRAKRAATAFVKGMRHAFSHFDDNTEDVATEIERMADELENTDEPTEIIGLVDEIDAVIDTLNI